MTKIEKVSYGTARCCIRCKHMGEWHGDMAKVDYCKRRPKAANKCGHQTVRRFENVCIEFEQK